jgi:hypothetical protein
MTAVGVDSGQAFRLTIGSIPFITGGAVIFTLLAGSRRTSFFEIVGIGFAVSTILHSTTSFVLGELGYHGIVDDVLLFVVLCCLSLMPCTRLSSTTLVRVESPVLAQTLLVTTLISYFAWSSVIWPYLLVIIFSVLLPPVCRLIRYHSRVQVPRNYFLFVLTPFLALATQALASSIFNLPKPYLQIGLLTDNIFDETLTWSVARFGYSENPFFSGGTIIGYQLVNSWVGNFSSLFHTQPFVILAAFSPLFAVASILAISTTFFSSSRPRVVFLIIVLVGLQGSFGELFPISEPPRAQQLVTTSWVLLAVFLGEEWLRSRKPRWLICSLLATFAAILGKTQLSTIPILFLIVNVVFLYINKGNRKSALLGLCGLMVTALVFLQISATYLDDRSNPWQINLDLGTLSTWIIPILLTLLLRWVLATLNNSGALSAENSFAMRTLTVSLICVLTYALTHDSNGLRHVISVIVALGAIAAADSFDKSIRTVGLGHAITLIGIGCLVGALFYYGRERTIILNPPKDHWTRLVSLEHPMIFQFLSVLLAGFTFGVLRIRPNLKKAKQLLVSISIMCSLISLGTNFGVHQAWAARQELRGLVRLEIGQRWPRNDVPNLDVVPATQWIRSNTKADEVIASNNICPTIPSSGVNLSADVGGDCLRLNMSSFIAAYSQRLTYLDGPSQAFIFPEFQSVANQRYRTSIKFASTNDGASHQKLIEDGVDYFVVDLTKTDLRSWEPRGTIRYQDDSFAVIELRD